jgi:hypothetical protein
MPIQRCVVNGQTCYRYGATGHPYPYIAGNPVSRQRARDLAAKQGRAIESSKHRRK